MEVGKRLELNGFPWAQHIFVSYDLYFVVITIMEWPFPLFFTPS